MKQATRFRIQRGCKILMLDMGLQPADVLRLAGLPTDLFSRDDLTLSADESLLLGFQDGNSFNRAFAVWMGTTPGEYRQSQLATTGQRH